MTIAELHLQIRTQYEAVASHTLDHFLPHEIDLYINRALRTYINQQRTFLLSAEENVQSREASGNLHTLIEMDTVTSFTQRPEYGANAVSLALSSLSEPFDYFIKGRLKDDVDAYYTMRKASWEEWHEHLPTAHTIAIFRRPVVVERNGHLWIATSSDTADVSEAYIVYLREHPRVSAKTEFEVAIAPGGGTGDATLTIGASSYTVPWQGDPLLTAVQFEQAFGAQVHTETGLYVSTGPTGLLLTGWNTTFGPTDLSTTDAEAALTVSLTTNPSGLDLHSHTHQDIVDLTVGLLRQDLATGPQPSDQE